MISYTYIVRIYTLNLRTPSPCSPMLEENKISNIKCSYNYTVLYFVSIVCHIMPLTMLYLYPHGLYSLLEF